MKRLAAVVLLAVLTGCTSTTPTPSPSPSSPPLIEGVDTSSVQPVGTPDVVADNLDIPWSIVPLESGSVLISERNTALVKELTASGEVRTVGTVPGVVPGGEGGLLGLAVNPSEPQWLYAYFTAADDNRIVRFALDGESGSYSLGSGEPIMVGIAKGGNHNGGRIAFGPDGMLYATTGDAGNPERSQRLESLNGKILRMSPIGDIPCDNPIEASFVFSMGHRNPQGLTWDNDRNLWAAEFGQNTWDELNLVTPGGNFGWPTVEGIGGNPEFIDPVAQWPTDDASPSGLLFQRNTFFMAALGGQRLWVMYRTAAGIDDVEYFAGEYGRIRDVAPGPDGSLYFVTNNTDGRGTPAENDDKLYRVQLDPLPQS